MRVQSPPTTLPTPISTHTYRSTHPLTLTQATRRYDLQGLSEGVAESFRGLLGESADNALDPERTALQARR